MLPAKLEVKDPADVHVCTDDIHTQNATTSYAGHILNVIQLLVISNQRAARSPELVNYLPSSPSA